MIDALREFIKAHERWFSWGAFLTGFTWDNITLNRIDQLYDIFVLVGLLCIATFGILTLNRLEEKKFTSRYYVSVAPFIPLVIQFSLGGLFSGLFVFYSRSGDLVSALPFLIILVGLLIGNEFLRHRHAGITIQLTIYYIALLSLTVLLVPVLVGDMGPVIFLISGGISLVLIVSVWWLFMRFAPRRFHAAQKNIIVSTVTVLLIFNGLYFTNIIPPIPLSMKELGIYHSVVREGSEYIVRYEPGYWWEFWKTSDRMFHYKQGDSLYCFASVFAPTALDTKIVHHWMYKNAKGEWESRGKIPYAISGGRDQGFRGFTVKNPSELGRWRCQVETLRGQVIGRVRVDVAKADGSVDLITEIR